MDEEELLSTTQAAKRISVSRNTIWVWTRNGKLPARRFSKYILISAKDLDEANKRSLMGKYRFMHLAKRAS